MHIEWDFFNTWQWGCVSLLWLSRSCHLVRWFNILDSHTQNSFHESPLIYTWQDPGKTSHGVQMKTADYSSFSCNTYDSTKTALHPHNVRDWLKKNQKHSLRTSAQITLSPLHNTLSARPDWTQKSGEITPLAREYKQTIRGVNFTLLLQGSTPWQKYSVTRTAYTKLE